MKKKKILIANYSQQGHYMYNEDTWSDKFRINSRKDFLDACKSWHKRSSSNFNDYPFGGLFSFQNISFQNQDIIIDDEGNKFYGKKYDCENPEYFNEVKDEFNKWIKAIKLRLPLLRKAREKRLKEESDFKKFKELSIKFESKAL